MHKYNRPIKLHNDKFLADILYRDYLGVKLINDRYKDISPALIKICIHDEIYKNNDYNPFDNNQDKHNKTFKFTAILPEYRDSKNNYNKSGIISGYIEQNRISNKYLKYYYEHLGNKKHKIFYNGRRLKFYNLYNNKYKEVRRIIKFLRKSFNDNNIRISINHFNDVDENSFRLRDNEFLTLKQKRFPNLKELLDLDIKIINDLDKIKNTTKIYLLKNKEIQKRYVGQYYKPEILMQPRIPGNLNKFTTEAYLKIDLKQNELKINKDLYNEDEIKAYYNYEHIRDKLINNETKNILIDNILFNIIKNYKIEKEFKQRHYLDKINKNIISLNNKIIEINKKNKKLSSKTIKKYKLITYDKLISLNIKTCYQYKIIDNLKLLNINFINFVETYPFILKYIDDALSQYYHNDEVKKSLKFSNIIYDYSKDIYNDNNNIKYSIKSLLRYAEIANYYKINYKEKDNYDLELFYKDIRNINDENKVNNKRSSTYKAEFKAIIDITRCNDIVEFLINNGYKKSVLINNFINNFRCVTQKPDEYGYYTNKQSEEIKQFLKEQKLTATDYAVKKHVRHENSLAQTINEMQEILKSYKFGGNNHAYLNYYYSDRNCSFAQFRAVILLMMTMTISNKKYKTIKHNKKTLEVKLTNNEILRNNLVRINYINKLTNSIIGMNQMAKIDTSYFNLYDEVFDKLRIIRNSNRLNNNNNKYLKSITQADDENIKEYFKIENRENQYKLLITMLHSIIKIDDNNSNINGNSNSNGNNKKSLMSSKFRSIVSDHNELTDLYHLIDDNIQDCDKYDKYMKIIDNINNLNQLNRLSTIWRRRQQQINDIKKKYKTLSDKEMKALKIPQLPTLQKNIDDINNNKEFKYNVKFINSQYKLIQEGNKMGHCVSSYFDRCIGYRYNDLIYRNKGNRRISIILELRVKNIKQYKEKLNDVTLEMVYDTKNNRLHGAFAGDRQTASNKYYTKKMEDEVNKIELYLWSKVNTDLKNYNKIKVKGKNNKNNNDEIDQYFSDLRSICVKFKESKRKNRLEKELRNKQKAATLEYEIDGMIREFIKE